MIQCPNKAMSASLTGKDHQSDYPKPCVRTAARHLMMFPVMDAF
jgi:hypothetical protein